MKIIQMSVFAAAGFARLFKSPGSPEAYIISRDELAAKIDEMYALGGNQVLLQGEHHPGLPFRMV